MKSKFTIQIVMIVLGIFFLIQSFQIKTMGFKGDILNQRDYVIVLAILIIIASTASILVEYRRGRKGENSEEILVSDVGQAEVEVDKKELKKNKKNVYITMTLVLLFAYGFTYIGFFVTSFIFVFLFTWLMFNWSKKKILTSIIFSVSLNIVLYVLFDLISVYFPKSLLF